MNKKIIYLDVTADLATAIDKMANVMGDEVVLVIPKSSALFHGSVNLKILKSNAESMGKNLSISTLDQAGRALAEKVGIVLRSSSEEENASVAPVVASNDNQGNVQPTKLPPIPITNKRVKIKYKPKFPEFRRTKETVIKVDSPSIVATDADIEESRPRLKIFGGKTNPSFLFILLALIILGGVFYFVLPRATVSLEIKSEPFNHKFKLVLADAQDPEAAGQNVFKGRFIEVPKEIIQTFPATGVKNYGNPASGEIVIYNRTKVIQGLVAQTRFVSPDGQVFRIDKEILIAPARAASNGSLMPGRSRVRVAADSGGSVGNLPAGTKLTIPGLNNFLVELVYGQNDEPFVGGTDDEVKIISEDDIKSARESISKNVFSDIAIELQKQVKKDEELITALIQNDIIDSVPSNGVGDKREAFDLRVQVRSWTLLPLKGRLASIIQNSTTAVVPIGKELTPQTLKNPKVTLDNADFLSHIIDYTVEIDGLVASKIDEAELVGSIANRSEESVSRLITSLTDIVSHKIVLWPFWVKKLPLLESNIKINTSYIGQ
ncbi:baseplate J/gp47 family protein [Patescibacteria group bacterium]|nr:baseplate J/gp47 family protein [Patescibacteria group bacterium]